MKDFYGRNINYMRVSITDRCNLRCKYCIPAEGIKKVSRDEILKFEELIEIIKVAVKCGVNKVRITGGEPLVRLGVEDFIKEVATIKGIEDLALTTNGILLKQKAKKLKDAGLHRVNISLDTLNEEKYREITRGGEIKHVLEGIEECIKVGFFPLKINVVLIKNFNEDEIEDFINLTKNQPLIVRFIELMPGSSEWSDGKYLSNQIILKKFPDLIPMTREENVGPSKYYKIKGYQGKIGVISAISNSFCENCNRIRITSEGKIKNCLYADSDVDLKEIIRKNPEGIEEAFRQAISLKPAKHNLNESNSDKYTGELKMSKIGG